MSSRAIPDFAICPHCWHLNGPASRVCLRCRADMTLVLQESGGERWSAPVQSPVPVARALDLSRGRRAVLFGLALLVVLAQAIQIVGMSRIPRDGTPPRGQAEP
jgi:hypothetical protein